MRVLVLCTTYPRNKNDISAVFLKTLYKEISKLEDEIEISIITSRDNDKRTANYELDGSIKLIRFNYWIRRFQTLTYGDAILSNLSKNRWNYLLVPLFIISFIQKSLAFVIRNKPNVIHCHWAVPCGIIGVILKKIFRVPLIVTSHGGDVYGFNSGWKKYLLKFVYRNADIINTVSSPLKEEVLKLSSKFSEKIWIMSMGVDCMNFNKNGVDDSKLKNLNHHKSLLFVGRFTEVKGIFVLLEGMKTLSKHGFFLNVIGAGNLSEAVKCFVVDNNLGDSVTLLGVIKNRDLPEHYRNSKITIIPSIPSVGGREGLPVTFMEAVLCGNSIVASRIGGLACYQDMEGIELIEPGDADGLVHAVLKLSTLDFGGHSEELLEDFNVVNIGNAFIEKYRILNNNG